MRTDWCSETSEGAQLYDFTQFGLEAGVASAKGDEEDEGRRYNRLFNEVLLP